MGSKAKNPIAIIPYEYNYYHCLKQCNFFYTTQTSVAPPETFHELSVGTHTCGLKAPGPSVKQVANNAPSCMPEVVIDDELVSTKKEALLKAGFTANLLKAATLWNLVLKVLRHLPGIGDFFTRESGFKDAAT